MKNIFIILLILFIFPLLVNAQVCEDGSCSSDSNNQIRMHKNTYQNPPQNSVRVIRNRPVTIVRVVRKGENIENYCVKYPYDFVCQNSYNDYYMFPPPPPPRGNLHFHQMPPPPQHDMYHSHEVPLPSGHNERPNQEPQSSAEYRAIRL